MSRTSFAGSQWGLLSLVIVALSTSLLSADPIEETPYGKSCLRMEGRTLPKQDSAAAIDKLEAAMAKAGVGSRWIQVVDDGGSPLVENPFLPCPYSAEVAKANEKTLEYWVDVIHQSGMPVVSWFSLSYCASGNELHPDWRQVSILPWPHEGAKNGPCCVNSPYGDALIAYCNWAIERFKLDGLWFDGSFWTPLWERPVPLTCRCAACRRMFKAETGFDIPEQVDWSNPVFRRWVAWRYPTFGRYIDRLAKAVREKHPSTVVVINHYHRIDAPWYGGVPLDKFAADIITGSEAYTAETVDQTMRLCRAYGRSQSEVWRQFDVGPDPQTGAEHLLEHALVCYSVGGQPSFGFDTFSGEDEDAAAAAAIITPVMKAIHPFVGGSSLPYCAVHVSQQTETFFFGPTQGREYQVNTFFHSLMNWSEGFGRAHLPPDFVFDADFTPETLSRYKLLLMPLSVALNDTQVKTVVEYVRSGGTLLLGPGAGQCDALGATRAENPLAKAFGFAFDRTIPPKPNTSEVIPMVDDAGRQTIVQTDRRAGLQLAASDWKVLCREGKDDQSPPALVSRPFGQGRILVMSLDGVDVLKGLPVDGGDTQLQVVTEMAASSKHSLKFTDGPAAPESYYPDFEIPLVPFKAPNYVGGTLQFDLKVDGNAALIVEIRSNVDQAKSPRLSVEPNGRVSLCGCVVGKIPVDQWVHVVVFYDFAQEGKPSACRAVIALADGKQIESPQVPTPAAKYAQTDRLVVFGPNATLGTFYLDNLNLSARNGDGSQVPIFHEDFENESDALAVPLQLQVRVAEMLSSITPPPIVIEAPDEVRTGIFESGDSLYVHLHNRQGLCRDWQQLNGPEVVLRGCLPIREAKLAVSNRPLEVAHQGDNWEIRIPPIGLYQVIELKR